MDALAQPLPALREDIRLLTGAGRGRDGMVHDPLRDSYFAVSPEVSQILSFWPHARDARDLAARVEAAYDRHVDPMEIMEIAAFLNRSELTLDPPEGWSAFARRADAREGWLRAALHHYLFFKIPIVWPAVFLERTAPFARLLVSPVALILIALATLLGAYLMVRQWGQVVDDVRRQMTVSGAVLFAATLFVMKIFHELGHGYVATAMGVRVRSMGIAFMVLTPMLYTDVTNAWRLPQRRKRIAIDIAGVAVEMAIAGLATLAWAFLPPGDLRDAMLVVVVSAWVMSLALNLSPFMRFDGYYILADFLGVKNLQPRAFALVRWRLRERLFDLGEPCPDPLTGGKRTFVIAYGVATMIYRLVLFIGVALLVYHMFFKLLGVFLFAVEIVVFVIGPIWREGKVWWAMRARLMKRPRAWITLSGAGACVALAFVPLNAKVRIPAVMEPAQFARLFPSSPGEISALHVRAGQTVKAGEALVTLSAPKLEKELEITRAKLALTEQRMARRMGDRRDYAQTLSLEKDRLSLLEKRAALEEQIEKLSIRAPIDGVVQGLDPDLHVGRLLSRQDEIGLVVGGAQTIIRGYADQQDLWRIHPGAHAVFIPDDLQTRTIAATLQTTAPVASASIDIPHLSETYGGRVRVHPPQPNANALVPLDPVHVVTLEPDAADLTLERPQRGVVVVEGAPQSFVAAFWRRGLKVIVQEFGV